MVSRETFKQTIRQILEEHGIQDKDKLDHIPEAITLFHGNCIAEFAMDMAQGLAEGDVEIFMQKVKKENGL